MVYDVEVRRLSAQFAAAYPPSQYPEILYKAERPYTCLLIDTHEEYFICVPFRSHINHNNVYLFKDTKRSKRSRSGLDYSKIALVSKLDYIDDTPAVVDHDEYAEVMRNIEKIISEILTYINTYVEHIKSTQVLHPKLFSRYYKFSTLPYFHDVLGI